ncbi:MAG: hypothetical protein IPN71_16370 [Fibrobacteres bacterium]|nr:hypothetical protein [Fibrobacterota bacterium]
MTRFHLTLLVVPAMTGATGLIQFEANKPAIARDVNENFTRLDTAIQNRATKPSLEATDGALKSVLATVGQLQSAKADQSGLDQLKQKQKTDSATLAGGIKEP